MEELVKLADVQPDYEKYPYVCADTETTGLSKNAEVIEVTLTEFNKSGEKGVSLHYLCEPISGFIEPGASRVNGLYMKDVAGYPSYLKGGVKEDCAEFLSKRTFVAHNAEYDLGKMKINPNNVYDTLLKARKKWPRNRNNLKACINRIGKKWNDEEAHRASYDVDKCIELFLYFETEMNAQQTLI